MIENLLAHEIEVGPERFGVRLDTEGPWVGEHRAAQRLAVRDVHAAADPDRAAVVGNVVPEVRNAEIVPVAEVEDLVIGVVLPGVDGDPLDPRIEERRYFGGFGNVDVRFRAELLERRKPALLDEFVYERWRQLVQLQQDDSTLPHGPPPVMENRLYARHAGGLRRADASGIRVCS